MRKLKNNFFVQFNIKYIIKILEISNYWYIENIFFQKKYIIKKKIIENQKKNQKLISLEKIFLRKWIYNYRND